MPRHDEDTAQTLRNDPTGAPASGVEPSTSTNPSPAGALVPGDKLANGRFEVRRRVGEGGMGVVFEAFDAQRRARVALKTLHRLEAGDIYQLKSEFRMLANVSHPNLVRLHELFADERTCFFTMDLVDGVQFDDWFGALRKASAPGTALGEPAWAPPLRSVLSQLVAAISTLHGQGKLHRDLKPSNVMVDQVGRVVVLDFGLAITEQTSHERFEAIGELSGTPAYMAPEQTLGVELTAASDWYALGVMLFQALSGQLPFFGSFNDILIAKQLRSAPPVAALASNLPEDLSALCDGLLSIDPAARPDAEALRAVFGTAPMPLSSASHHPPVSGADIVGRDAELGRLLSAYATSSTSTRPTIRMLKGESGIGKSTVVARFLEHLSETSEAVVLRGRCYERESVPFKAFDVVVDDLSRYLKSLDREACFALRPREAWALVRLFPVLGRVPALAHDPAREGANPHETRRRGFAAFGELLGRIRRQRPLVLFIDDLHWSDADSMALLLHLLRQADGPELLFVGTRREGDWPLLYPLYDKLVDDIRVDFGEIELLPLAADQARLVVGQDTPEAVLAEARGNPFLLRELAHCARRQGTAGIVGQSLNAVLWQSCAALTPDAQRLLHAIALSAGSVPLEVPLNAAQVEPRAYDALRDQRLVRPGVREGEVECYHDKIREAVLAAFPAEATRALHRSLADAWQTTSDPNPELSSIHYEHAGERARAAELSIDAAERAALCFGFGRAVELFTRALDLGNFSDDTVRKLKRARANVLAQSGRSLEAAKDCVAALAGASPREREDLARRAGGFYLQCGRIEEALPLINQGLARYGLSVPTTTAGAVASLIWERTRLKLRGYTPRPDQHDAWAAERFAAAEFIANALPGLDPIRYPSLATRLLRLALDSGNPVLIARSMASEVLVGLILALPEPQLRELAASAEAHCSESDDPVALFWLHQSLSTLELSDNPRRSLTHLNAACAILTTHPSPAFAHFATWLEWSRLQVMGLQGELLHVARVTPALLDDAWAQDNRGVIPFLAGVPGAIARVAVEDLASLRRDLELSRKAWQQETFTWQDIMQTQGEVALATYTGELGPALSATELLKNKLEKSLARRAASVRGYVGYVSSWISLAHARELPPGLERRKLLERAAASLEFCHSKRLTAAWSSPLEPALEVLRGNSAGAVRLLRTLLDDADACDRLPVYAVCARRGLGTLLGGDEGSSLVSEADAYLRARGVVDPARFVGCIAPGLSG